MTRHAYRTILLLSALALPLHARFAAQEPVSVEPQAASTAPFPEHLVEGRGAPHNDYNDCVAGLPALTKSLTTRGFKITESATCSPIEGQVENYAPSFRAWSPMKYEFRQITGGAYSSSAICDSVAEKMRADLAHTEMVLEVGCAGTSGVSQMGRQDVAYQPIAVVIAIP